MDVFAQDDYKAVIHQRLGELKRAGKRVSLKKVAERIPIQYTYLSRLLNHPKMHLNEDHLFAIGNCLEFFPEEMEYLSLLRASAVAQDPARKKHLQGRLGGFRVAHKLHASIQEHDSMRLSREIDYLFEPLCVLVHVSLHIEEIMHDPRRLCPLLGISSDKLAEVLRRLNQLEFVQLGNHSFEVLKVRRGHSHYSTDHPLMRMHQNVMRSASVGQVIKTSEADKHSFTVTFTADPCIFSEIKECFQRFLEEVEKLVVKAPSRNTYQMNFDLFKWL